MSLPFTETQRLQIVRITGVPSDLQEDIFNMYSAAITAEVETQVGALILEWFPASGTGAGRNFTDIEPKEKNFGANIKTSRTRDAIRKEIGDLLYLTPYMTSGGSRLVRS